MSPWQEYKQTSFYHASFTLLHFADNFFFNKSIIFGNPVLSTSIGTIFSTTFAHILSLCHILVILALAFSLLLYLLGDLWSVIFDVTTVIVLRNHKFHSHDKLNKCVFSECSTNRPFPCLSPFPWAFLFPKTQKYWNQAN